MNLSFLKEKKNKYIVIALLGLLVLVLLMPTSSADNERDGNVSATENASERETEAQLKKVLSAMEGVGAVEVMITYETQGNTLFGTSTGSGKVCGVVVVAEGAGNAVVETRILNAVKALFSIEAHKISIVKRAK